jgi:hypothetical protein
LMRENQVRRIPVVDQQGILQGIVSMADLLHRTDVPSKETHETLKKVSEPSDISSQPRAQQSKVALQASPARNKAKSRCTDRWRCANYIDEMNGDKPILSSCAQGESGLKPASPFIPIITPLTIPTARTLWNSRSPTLLGNIVLPPA